MNNEIPYTQEQRLAERRRRNAFYTFSIVSDMDREPTPFPPPTELPRRIVPDYVLWCFFDHVPVLLDFGNGFIPYSLLHRYGYDSTWEEIPGYPPLVDMVAPLPGYKPWFGIFLDIDGQLFTAYYPIAPAPGDKITVPVYWGDTRIACIPWIHGQPCLSDYVLDAVLVQFSSAWRFEIPDYKAALPR